MRFSLFALPTTHTLAHMLARTHTHTHMHTAVPLPHTVIDFWQMVWQERASCLVLLTLNKEEGRGMPGERYCSDDIGTWCIGPFLVSTTHKTQCAHHTIRHISVQVSRQPPRVQFQGVSPLVVMFCRSGECTLICTCPQFLT